MAYAPRMGEESGKSRTQVVLAVIGLVGTLGAAAFASWDKLFPPEPVRAARAMSSEPGAPEAEPATYLLSTLTCLRTQEDKKDSVYLRVDGDLLDDWKMKVGETADIGRTVERGAHVALYEMDGWFRDGDDDLLGEGEISGGDGELRFESKAHGSLYLLRYEPGS